MRELIAAFGGLVVFLLAAPSALAAPEILFARSFAVCEPLAGVSTPRPDERTCAPTTIDALDPQGREIWVAALVDVPPAFIVKRPHGLYIAAKASSEAFVNGAPVGANGAPAAAKNLETPGLMDAVFHIPDGVLRAGENRIMVRLSSHHGVLKLRRPVHWIAVGRFAEPTPSRLQTTWPAIAAFGVLLSGGLYFAAAAFGEAHRRDSFLLALLASFAAAQLLAELVRSIVPYPYPAHDLRLVAIVATSAGFGLCLSALVISRFAAGAKLGVFAAVAALTALTIALAEGFDAKAGYAILASTIASATIAARAALRGDRHGLVFAVALFLFGASIVAFRGAFLDVVFFFEVAALMLVLFAAQAVILDRERLQRIVERTRAHELDAALARVRDAPAPAVIRVNAAGSLNLVPASNITHFQGAGDYVELHLTDGRRILHNGALAQLENDLPPNFLRVHRSFIVNTDFVKSLSRESSGVGALVLSNGAEIPVSRRTMPRVRVALA